MKLVLDTKEKKELLEKGILEIERRNHIPCPKTSIIYGHGDGVIFDKIDYWWVYGDTAAYIEKMKNVGRRGVDYKNNNGNTWNGKTWWEFEGKTVNEWNKIGDPIRSGFKNIIQYTISSMYVSELRKQTKNDTLIIIVNIKVELIK